MMQLQRQFQQSFQLGSRVQIISRRVLSTVESSSATANDTSVGATITADVSHAPTVLSGDLAAQVKSADNEKLRGKFVKIGPLLESLEVPRRFEKTEWSTKMYKRGENLGADEHKKARDSVPARGGRWDPPSLIDEQERHIMLRDQALNLCREMEAAGAENAKPVAKLLVGKRGCGKSATLLTALAYARTNGWLTMYLPRPTDLVTEIGAYFSGTAGPVAILPESTIGQGLFQQPNAAKEILEMTDNIHGDVLPLLPQRRKYKHDLYKPKQGQQATLAHILMRGLAQPHRAADALYDLRMEFNLVTEVPVLIAVDEFNALYWPTALAFQSKSVKAHQLVVAKAFRFVNHVPGDIEDDDNRKAIRRAKLNEEHLPVRGALIGAVTNSIDPPPHKEQMMPARFEQFEIDNVGKIDVSRYSGDEIQTMLNWYQMKGACRPQSQTDVSFCKIYTGGVGEKVAQYALGMTLGL